MKALFTAALWLQLVWFLLAVTYNCLSLAAMADGGPGFAGDQPTTISALIAVFAFGAVTLTGFMPRKRLYRIAAPIVLVLLLVGGVLKHLTLGPASYASYDHWLAAILINAFGVAAYTFGARVAFSHAAKTPE